MDDQSFEIAKMGFLSAQQLAQQLITLSTGILALTITFTKDIVKATPKSPMWLLKLAWISFLSCIIFGVGAMSALTGGLVPLSSSGNKPSLTIAPNARVLAGFQDAAFLIGIVLVIIYGVMSLRKQVNEISDVDAGKD
jgi:hypothetical protein